jgi:hypothetical protein
MLIDYMKREERLRVDMNHLTPLLQEVIDDQRQKLKDISHSINDLQSIYCMIENQLIDNLEILYTKF